MTAPGQQTRALTTPGPGLSKFSTARVALLLSALRQGSTRNAAATFAEVHRSVAFQDWLDKKLPSAIVLPELITGAGETTYPKGITLKEAIERAENEAENALMRRIELAAMDSAKVTYHYDRNGNLLREVREYDWRAAAWLLERHPKHRKNWAAPARHEISGPDGGPILTDGRASVTFQPSAEWLAALGKAADTEAKIDRLLDDGDTIEGEAVEIEVDQP